MKELKRKLFHLLSAGYGLLYAVLPRETSLRVMGLFGVIVMILEWMRIRFPAFNNWTWRHFSVIAREDEKERVSGMFWTWLGSFLTMLFFVRRDIVLAALGAMVFGDAAAALVGKAWGRHPWARSPGKSMEGTFAFAVAATAAGCWFLPLPRVIVAAVAAAWAESYHLPWDDNLWIPLIAGGCLTLLSY